MPHEMFDDIVNPSVKVGTRKWYTLPLSIGNHVFVLGSIVAAPLLATNVLPLPDSVVIFVPDPPPPPPTQLQPPETHVRPDVTPVDLNPDAAPLEEPTVISPEPPYRPPALHVGVPADSGLFPNDASSGVGISAPPRQPDITPLRVGGLIQAPQLLKRVSPVYPAMARNARREGYAIIEATIGRDGAVRDVKLLKSAHPLLDKAALDAVAQWRYSPTLLNGEAVEVTLSVTVTFALR